jgi:hypothetical protein
MKNEAASAFVCLAASGGGRKSKGLRGAPIVSLILYIDRERWQMAAFFIACLRPPLVGHRK